MEEYFANKPAMSSPPVPRAEAPAGDAPNDPAAYTAEVNANAEPGAEAKDTDKPAGETAKPEEAKAEGEEAKESTDQEYADAATKISAVYRGKKAREDVAEMKAKKAEGAGDEAKPEETPAEGAPADAAPAEEKKDDAPAEAAPEEKPAE